MLNASLLHFPTRKELAQDVESRLCRRGGSALSDDELVELAIGPQMAAQFETSGDHWHHLLYLDYLELREQDVDHAEAVSFLAHVELARRFAKTKALHRWRLDKPAELAQYLILQHFQSDHEVVGAVFLDARSGLIADEVLYRGTLSRTSVEPRAFLRRGLALHASSFVLFHTHPSGDLSPSNDDIYFTRRLQDAADVVGIELNDHLILCPQGRWASLRHRGLLESSPDDRS